MKGYRRSQGRLPWLCALALVGLLLGASPTALAADGNQGCLGCHAHEMTTTFEGREVSLKVDEAALAASPHADVTCSLCHAVSHGPLDEVREAAYESCANCHSGYVFGEAGLFNHPDPPLTCESCHGPIHAVIPSDDPESPLSRERNVDYCGACHQSAAQAYFYSYHGSAYRLGSDLAPVCADCHGHLPLTGAGSPEGDTSVFDSCGSGGCHLGSAAAMANLVASGAEHVTPLDRAKGIEGTSRWVVWKFFLLLILFNVTKDGAVVALDLARRLRNGGKSGNGNGKGGRN